MHISFAARGTGSARAAADYLVGERDSAGRVRPGIEVLRGNPDHVAALADSLEFERKYTSGVIAWAPEDRPDRRPDRSRPRRVRGRRRGRDWSPTATPGRRSSTGRTATGVHVHVLTARCDLETGRSLNIAPPGWQKTFDALRDAFNHQHGWARPDDPGAGQGPPARPSRLHRGGEAPGRARARTRPARGDPRLPPAAGRARHGAEPRRRGRRPGGGRLRGAPPGQGLPDRPRS